MAVPMSDEQRRAAVALLREQVPDAAEIGRLFARHGHELALVGGPVRDVFLGQRPGDLDLTTDATPDQVLEMTKGWADKTWTIGIAFGTVGLRKGNELFEITTYRSEQYERTSRRPDVQYGRSLEEDLGRRDFTINAMAARLPGYEFVDPYRGFDALREKVLRTPGPPEQSFSDDPLRILRAARFAAKLGFTVAPEVRVAMTEQAGRLEIVSAERITSELTKLMLTPDPALGIDVLVQTEVADEVLPEVSRLRMEADEHHRHKDVYQHSLTVLRQAIELEPRYGLDGDLTVRLAALLHDIGKPRTRSLLPDGRVAFHLHEVNGAKMTKRRLTALRFPNDVVRDVSRLVELHLRFHGYGEGEWTDAAVRRYVRDAGPAAVPAARADQGRLHDQEPREGGAAGPRLRRASSSASPSSASRRSWPGSGRNSTATRSCASWAWPLVRWWEGPTTSCSSCGSRRASWAGSGLLRTVAGWAVAEGIIPSPPEPDED